MNKLTDKHLIALNEKIAFQNSEVPSVSDPEKLKLIVEKPFEKDEKLFYVHKNKVDKASVLGLEIATERPFANNNLATATLAMFTFLELNGQKVTPEQEDIYLLHDLLREGEEERITEWIKFHI